MKISSMLSMAVLAVAGYSWGDAAYSENTFAMVKVLSAETNTLIAVPWTGYFTNGAEKVDSLVDHIVKPENLTTGDILLSVQDKETYQGWVLSEIEGAKNGERFWNPAEIVERVRLIHSSISQAGVSNLIARGYGLWLIRQEPVDMTTGKAKPFYLEGQYATEPAVVEIAGGVDSTNAVMVASPFCSGFESFDINTDISWNGEAIVKNGGHIRDAGDSLGIPNGTDGWDYCLWDVNSNMWYCTKYVPGGRKGSLIPTKDFDLKIDAGRGFWYVRRGSDPITITFNPPSPSSK